MIMITSFQQGQGTGRSKVMSQVVSIPYEIWFEKTNDQQWSTRHTAKVEINGKRKTFSITLKSQMERR
jgi:hypothetical protein